MDTRTAESFRAKVLPKALRATAAALLAGALALLLTGCLGLWPLGISSQRDENLTLGGTELTDPPASLEIHWVAGKVTVKYHEGEALVFSERVTSMPELDENLQLTWEISGDALVIDYVQPKVRTMDLVKELTVLVPESMDIDDITIEATSADVVLPELQADSIWVTTTSGEIMATCTTRLMKLMSTSGDITAACEARDIEVTTTSGKQEVTQSGSAEDVELASTSGVVRLFQRGQADEVGVETTSGSVQVDLVNANSVDIETTSGDVRVAFPKAWGFTGSFSTVSGKLSSDVALTSSRAGQVYGDGAHELEVETTSGDIALTLAG